MILNSLFFEACARQSFEVEILFDFLRVNLRDLSVASVNSGDVPKDVPKDIRLRSIVDLISGNHRITIEELAMQCGVSHKTLKRDVEGLKEEGLIKRLGGRKTGYWQIIGKGNVAE